eukprot:TRINITY_DN735_c0_g4_i3.p1 TRINITY_DN735_c0_g4~~TRINITY_DN735_c0_g4_i3.p1  ORF type:complete len:139 (+),score=34.99 TRINITY_DN735_c0_g4_i3:173-589(+)
MASDDLELFIRYADELESRNPVVAQQFRMYFMERQMENIKKTKGQDHKKEKTAIAEQLKKTEDLNKKLNLTNEQKKEQMTQYCKAMFSKVMNAARQPNCKKPLCISKLHTMLDFIHVLTVFGPLSAEWSSNSTRCVTE